MTLLSEVKQLGKYTIVGINGDKKLAHHLAEMGMITGQNLNVITLPNKNGAMIFFQGQRLGISPEISNSIEVKSLKDDQNVPLDPLTKVKIKQSGIIKKISGDRVLRKRLMDMGLTKNTTVKVEKVAPLGDPIEIIVRGYKLSLRKRDANNILLEVLNDD